MFIPFLDCVSLLMGWAVQLSNVLQGKGNRNTIEKRALHATASCIILTPSRKLGSKLSVSSNNLVSSAFLLILWEISSP